LGVAKHIRDPDAIERIAKNVRRYRTEKQISMEKLALILGIEYTTIARLEYQQSNPSISLIFAIAKVLEIEPQLLLMKIAE